MIELERPKSLKELVHIAPLLDIIFLLLLFFILTYVFLEPGIPVDLPEAATAQYPEEEPGYVIFISRLGAIYLNDQMIPFDQLLDVLSARFQERTERHVTIKADKEVAFGLFVRVMDIAKQAGGEDLIIAAEFPEKR